MTLSDFLDAWKLAEHPFRGEEARSDDVFARMSGGLAGVRTTTAGPPGFVMAEEPSASGSTPTALGTPTASEAGSNRSASITTDSFPGAVSTSGIEAKSGPIHHSDFDKILGDLRRPGASVVFGEKGSGKTALRFQLGRRILDHNAAHPGAKVLLLGYDDLNAFCDRIHEKLGSKTALESLQKIRLVDHVDAILHRVVPRIVDALLDESGPEPIDVPDAAKVAKRLSPDAKRAILTLQACYDRPSDAPNRTNRLRRRLRIWPSAAVFAQRVVLVIWPLLILAGLVWVNFFTLPTGLMNITQAQAAWGLATFFGIYALFALKVAVWNRLAIIRTGIRLRRQLRTVPRGDVSFARSIRQLPRAWRESSQLPVSDSDEVRYAMMDRLKGVLRAIGYAGLVVVVDRVDEPTLVCGDPERMKALIWPMLSNKFLQQEGVGIKLLLPMELRHAVFRESSAFFQGARLDKQSLVEHLSWTGTMLYDLCEGRLRSCLRPGAKSIRLLDLFTEDVTQEELAGAIERVHQPRDAFKLLYRCIAEHCASTPRDVGMFKIPRHTLLAVLKSETERVQQTARGIRPG